MDESMEQALDELERAYMEAADGDARDALRRSLVDAMEEIVTMNRQVSRGFVRAGKPADLARKLGRDRPDRQRQATAG